MGSILCCNQESAQLKHTNKNKKDNRQSVRSAVEGDDPIKMRTLGRQPSTEKERLEEEELRNRLSYEYSNPCERWKMKEKKLHARIPIKLIIQMLKIVFVTTQLILVGLQRSDFADFAEQSNNALKFLLLKDFMVHPRSEDFSAPIDAPDYSIYTKEDLFSHIDFAVLKFPEVPQQAMGSFYFTFINDTSRQNMKLCLTNYRQREFFSNNNSLNIDHTHELECFDLYTQRNASYSIKDTLLEKNLLGKIDRMFSLDLKFSLKMVRLSAHVNIWGVDCFDSEGRILFDHNERTGEVSVSLKTKILFFECQGSSLTSWRDSMTNIAIAVVVIMLNVISICLCIISIKNSILLLKDTREYFGKQNYEIKSLIPGRQTRSKEDNPILSRSEQIDLLKIWDFPVVINDMLTIAGTFCLLFRQTMVTMNLLDIYDVTTTLLGVGGLLVWMGILRYFSFFPEFYLLFLILKRALKSVIRYAICVVILYTGFVFCGWLALGPYHRKFRSLSSSTECLFATMNSDGLYETFTGITRQTWFMWFFSRFYLYAYIGIFTTLALNLVIAICMDSYDTVKTFCKEGFPQSELMTFIQGDDENGNKKAPHFCTRGFATETKAYVEEIKRPKTSYFDDTQRKTVYERSKTVVFDNSQLATGGGMTASFRA